MLTRVDRYRACRVALEKAVFASAQPYKRIARIARNKSRDATAAWQFWFCEPEHLHTPHSTAINTDCANDSQ
jgi:hypothetical protein